ncbi:MAG: ABC transporter permease subunit [Pseudomonadota bacterium]
MPRTHLFDHLILIVGVVFMMGPVGLLVWQLAAGSDPSALWALFLDVWQGETRNGVLPASQMMLNSFVLALGIALIKCAVSMLAAYALVMFHVPGREILFGAILVSMFFPIETRILPTFAVVSELGLLNSYTGMILPVVASGLGVLILRLYLQHLPPELFEAARLDGAGPVRFFLDFVLPLSLPMLAALFAILFVLGWNQYVWPIMVATTSLEHSTLVRGMASLSVSSQAGLLLMLLALLPPALVFLALQRWLVRGLTAGIH